MQKIIMLLAAALCINTINAQSNFKMILKDNETHQPIAGVTIDLKNSNISSLSNSIGFAEIKNIEDGNRVFIFSITGYNIKQLAFVFPLQRNDTAEIFLEKTHTELDEVIIQSTRTSRTINNTPTRVETIDGEELDE